MKVSLRQAFAILGIASFSSAALAQPTPWMFWLFLGFTALLVLGSIYLSIKKPRGRKSFWIWFAFASTIYLAFAHIPDRDGNCPRQRGLEPTTRLLVHAYNLFGYGPDAVAEDQTENRGGHFQVQESNFPSSTEQTGGFGSNNDSYHNNTTAADFSELIDLFIETTDLEQSDFDNPKHEFPQNLAGFGVYFAQKRHIRRFMYIGHCIWALMFGWIVGQAVAFMSPSTKRKLETVDFEFESNEETT